MTTFTKDWKKWQKIIESVSVGRCNTIIFIITILKQKLLQNPKNVGDWQYSYSGTLENTVYHRNFLPISFEIAVIFFEVLALQNLH
jgi:hypothetical protein